MCFDKGANGEIIAINLYLFALVLVGGGVGISMTLSTAFIIWGPQVLTAQTGSHPDLPTLRSG